MTISLVGVQGHLADRRFLLGEQPLTLGRGSINDLVLDDAAASRVHAELRRTRGGAVLKDLGSGNGTFVNGERVTSRQLSPGDTVTIGGQVFRFEVAPDRPTVRVPNPPPLPGVAAARSAPVLRVTVAGGGPVGMSFVLLLDHLLGPKVSITVHDGRWAERDGHFVWQNPEMGNNRRQQVVTVQSRQFLKLPPEVQERLFRPGTFTEMWPAGPDSIQGQGPRNIRIAFIEDELLAILDEKSDHIRLVTENYDATADDHLADQHVLAICEGGRSATREHFAARFGTADTTLYGLDGHQIQDMVLGLRVKSRLPDPMSVLLTVSQNRFLLNALSGDGFLNMRLTDQESAEAVGINPVRQVFTPCIQSTPCLLERRGDGEFHCGGHNAVFLPALLKGSALWERVQEGLTMYDVPPTDLSAVTGFRLDMVQRPRFTAELLPRTPGTPGTYGFLLGDAANAIHFWPGRGLNSGLASAISLARCLATTWRGEPFRDSAFTRHEAVMAMLQYRHKTRAFRQMVTPDEAGNPTAIKDLIARGIADGEKGGLDRDRDLELLMQRMRANRTRLAPRLPGLPADDVLRARLEQLTDETLHTLVVSDQWDSANVGGEEVDVDWLLLEPEQAAVPEPRQGEPTPQPAPQPAGWQPAPT